MFWHNQTNLRFSHQAEPSQYYPGFYLVYYFLAEQLSRLVSANCLSRWQMHDYDLTYGHLVNLMYEMVKRIHYLLELKFNFFVNKILSLNKINYFFLANIFLNEKRSFLGIVFDRSPFFCFLLYNSVNKRKTNLKYMKCEKSVNF